MNTGTSDKGQKIVCIGWGSLIWDKGRPFAVRGSWQDDGPELPLEFARQSGGNRITLVIVNSAHLVRTLWAELDSTSLDEAVLALAKREDVPDPKVIGRWPNETSNSYIYQSAIAEWASARGFAGVVWTALPEGMKNTRGVMPTLAEVEAYLAGLSSADRIGAAEYIHRAPAQIATPYRQHLEGILPFNAGDGGPA